MTRAFPINDQKITLLPNHFAVTWYFNGKIALVEDIKDLVLPVGPVSALVVMAVLLIPTNLVVNLLPNEFSDSSGVLQDLRVSGLTVGHHLAICLGLLVGLSNVSSIADLAQKSKESG